MRIAGKRSSAGQFDSSQNRQTGVSAIFASMVPWPVAVGAQSSSLAFLRKVGRSAISIFMAYVDSLLLVCSSRVAADAFVTP